MHASFLELGIKTNYFCILINKLEAISIFTLKFICIFIYLKKK